MKKIIIANCNEILNDIQEELISTYNAVGIGQKEQLHLAELQRINPDYIFFLHWSWIIPKEIYDNFTCVVFHMTDLPFGRGGSPLQNLIVRGYKKTKLSAIKVDSGIDTGDIYLKKDLSLAGTATEIFKRAGDVIKTMISQMVESNIEPVKQEGRPVYFKRRKPEQSVIDDNIKTIENMHDFIRMLDADNYPHARLESEFFKFELTNSNIINENELIANVRIIKK